MTVSKSFHSTVRLYPELADALRAYAVLHGSSLNDQINEAVRYYLKDHVTTMDPDKLREVAEDLVQTHVEALKKVESM